jgi:anhydro-N-acetylmuramic acid kinase
MVYKVIGLMSGSSLDGLDIAYVHLQERAKTTRPATSARPAPREWEFQLIHTACYPYTGEWRQRLAAAPELSALDYQLLHTEFGRYLGEQVLRFIAAHGLEYQVQLIASHGHTAFHSPDRKMTAQLGDGAALAATTRINVVSDLRAMDVALGGQGAPIVPIGEQLLLPGYGLFLNLGGIANISRHENSTFIAFDVCPANRVLNELSLPAGREYDEGGALAASGRVDAALLQQLNGLPYYGMDYPKSLANTFGTGTVLPMIREAMAEGRPGNGRLSTADALRTYTEHIVEQIRKAVKGLMTQAQTPMTATGTPTPALRMLVTGGGAHNTFLAERLTEQLRNLGVELVVPDTALVDFKEALIMALIGVLRWREENNVLASVTGASRDSIGGAVWIGQEA